MSSNGKVTQKLGLVSLILMIFTSVYGFNNMPRSFYLMGYAAIPWYILSAITFFIPFAFMMAEYGSAFKNERGGIFSWMEKSVGPRYAFIATFMWYASNIIWMVNVSSGIWVVVSNAIFGKDTTKAWSLFGLSTPKTLGILAVCWIIFVTFTATRGLDKIKKGWIRSSVMGNLSNFALNTIKVLPQFYTNLKEQRIYHHKEAQDLSLDDYVREVHINDKYANVDYEKININDFTGSGTDTLEGPNLANVWQITGSNQGTIGVTTAFAGFSGFLC